MYGSKADVNSFSISFSLSDPGRLLTLLWIAPIVVLEAGVAAKLDIEPKQVAYFRYQVKSSAAEGMVHIYMMPGADKVALYMSSEAMYPDYKNHQWTSIRTKALDGAWDDSELDPFALNEKSLVQYNETAYPVPVPATNGGSLGVKLEAYYWKHSKKVCYISAVNLTDQKVPLSMEIKGKCPGQTIYHRVQGNRASPTRACAEM